MDTGVTQEVTRDRYSTTARTRQNDWLARTVAVAVVLSFTAAFTARDAHAEQHDEAASIRLFNDGRVLGEADRWPQACPKLERSQRLAPALGTILYLARCYEHTGQLERARQRYRKAAELAHRAGNLVWRDFAAARADALDVRLGDPEVAADPPFRPSRARSRNRALGHRLTLGLGGVGLAVTATGLGFGAKARLETERAQALCTMPRSCTAADAERKRTLLAQARSDASASTVLIAAGGAAALTSAVLLAWRPWSRTRIAPLTLPGGAGLALSTRF